MSLHFASILGVDEAGRGPVLGPLCMASVLLDPPAARALKRLGVKDSKGYGHGPDARRERARLAREVYRRARWVEERVATAADVDARARRGQLNHLEQELAEDMIRQSGVLAAAGTARVRIVLDGRLVFGPLADRTPGAVAVDGAEDGWVAVAAASLVAKRRRDALYALIARRLRAELGLRAGDEPDPFSGQGYVNRATARVLEAYVARHGRLPAETRISWQWAFLVELAARHGLALAEREAAPPPPERKRAGGQLGLLTER